MGNECPFIDCRSWDARPHHVECHPQPPPRPEPPPQPLPQTPSQQPPQLPPCDSLEDNYVQMACRLIGHLANHLPTGSFFSFEVLSGLSNCKNKAVTIMLLSTFGAACFFSCFTDSFRVCGRTYFTFRTCDNSSSGQSCPCNACNNNNRRPATCHLPRRDYEVRCSDFIHAITSTAVYAAFVFSKPIVMDTFYPCAPQWLRQFLLWLRLLIFILAATVFCKFPSHRRGFGFAIITARLCR